MSGEVRQIGSVTFQPILERGVGIKVWRGLPQGPEWDAYRVWGWCTVVVARDQWTVKTRVEPAIECCNAMQPVIWHLTEAHGDEAGGTGAWEFKLTSSPACSHPCR